MTPQELMTACMKKAGAYLDCPFGAEPVCARVEKRIFAEIFLTRPWVTFKCEPMQGLVWREEYPQNIRRGWHCPKVQQPYNNTVTLDGTIPKEHVTVMLDHSYERALLSLTKEARGRVAALEAAKES